MARARNLKPGFFKDAKIVACSFPARLMFQGLWCLADYMGRLKYVPIEIKMELFPADDVDVESCMAELSAQGLIEIYRDSSGAALVQVTNFSRHQNPHVNERQGKDKKSLPCLPGPDECRLHDGAEKHQEEQQVRDALVVLSEYYQSDPADSLNLIPSYLLRKLAPSPDDAEPGDDPELPETEKPKRFVAKAVDLPPFVDRDNWVAWCEFRSSKRKPISEQAARQQIEMLARYPPDVQVAIVQQSIANDYQGLFAPKGASHAANQSRHQPVSEIDRVNAAISRRAREREAALSGQRGAADDRGDFLEADVGIVRIPVHPAVRR